MKRRGIIDITYELLEKLLELDSEHHIVGLLDCNTSKEKFSMFKDDIIKIKIEGPKMPEVMENDEIMNFHEYKFIRKGEK